MLVISKRKTRQWKQVLYFLVYIYLCDRKELNNTLAALFLIEKKSEVSSVFLLIYNLLANILDEHLTVRKNSCPFNLSLSRERMTFARVRETFCSCARYLSLECTWLSARIRMTVWSYTRDFSVVLAWLLARARVTFRSCVHTFLLACTILSADFATDLFPLWAQLRHV